MKKKGLDEFFLAFLALFFWSVFTIKEGEREGENTGENGRETELLPLFYPTNFIQQKLYVFLFFNVGGSNKQS